MAVRASVEQEPRVRRVEPTPLRSPAARMAVDLAIPVVVILVVLGPMAFDRSILGIDWFAHLWYVWHQSEALRDGVLPSLFAHSSAGVFDPHFAYYAGNVYALTGVLALVTGSPEAALDLMLAVAFACAYAGWFWLARLAGLNRWLAHAPGVLFVTSSYYVATVYGGGWLETTAVSALPLLAASAWSVARADRLRVGPALALAWSTFLFTGSHNLSLVWGTTMVVLAGVAVLALVPAARAALTERSTLMRLASVMVPATLLNAWFLLPLVAYQHGTVIATDRAAADDSLRSTMFMVKPDRLLTFGRGNVEDAIPFYVTALPLLAIAWVVVSLVLARTRHRAPAFRGAVTLLALVAVLSVLTASLSLLLALPSPWGLLQLGYRLEAYVMLAVSGAVVAALTVLRDRRWAWALLPILVISLAQGRQQATIEGNPDVGPSYQRATIPYNSRTSVQGSADYAEAKVPLAQNPGGAPIRFDPTHPDAPVAVAPGGADTERASNLVAAPTFVTVHGAQIVGRLPSGTAVLRVDDGATEVRVTARHPWPLQLGIVLSLLGLAGLGAALVLRPGARAPTTPAPPDAPAPRRRPR